MTFEMPTKSSILSAHTSGYKKRSATLCGATLVQRPAWSNPREAELRRAALRRTALTSDPGWLYSVVTTLPLKSLPDDGVGECGLGQRRRRDKPIQQERAIRNERGCAATQQQMCSGGCTRKEIPPSLGYNQSVYTVIHIHHTIFTFIRSYPPLRYCILWCVVVDALVRPLHVPNNIVTGYGNRQKEQQHCCY